MDDSVQLILVDGQGRRVFRSGSGAWSEQDSVRYLPLIAMQSVLHEEVAGEQVESVRWDDGACMFWRELEPESLYGIALYQPPRDLEDDDAASVASQDWQQPVAVYLSRVLELAYEAVRFWCGDAHWSSLDTQTLLQPMLTCLLRGYDLGQRLDDGARQSIFYESLEVLQVSPDLVRSCRGLLRHSLQAVAEEKRARVQDLLLFVDGKLLSRFNPSDLRFHEQHLFLFQWFALSLRYRQVVEGEQREDGFLVHLELRDRDRSYWKPFLLWSHSITTDITLLVISSDTRDRSPETTFHPLVHLLSSTEESLPSTFASVAPWNGLSQLSDFLLCKARSHVSILPWLASFPGLVHFALQIHCPGNPGKYLIAPDILSTSLVPATTPKLDTATHADESMAALRQQIIACLLQLRVLVRDRPNATSILARSPAGEWSYAYAKLKVKRPSLRSPADTAEENEVAAAIAAPTEIHVSLWSVWLGAIPFQSVEHQLQPLAQRLVQELHRNEL